MPAPEDNMRQSYAVSQYKNGGSPWMKESMSAQSIFSPYNNLENEEVTAIHGE